MLKKGRFDFISKTKNPAVLKNLSKDTKFRAIYCPVKFIN